MTATTDVVISEKSMLEFASVDFSGIAVSRMSVMRMGSLNLRDLGVDDDPMPLVDVFPEIGGKFLGRVADDVEPNLPASGLHVRKLQRLDDLPVQQRDDVRWCPGRHEDTLHRVGFLVVDTG